MAVSLGQVGIADKGYYQAGVTYQAGNFVFYQGSTYLCLKDNLTNYPPENDGTNWKYLAQGAGGITDSPVERFDTVSTNFPIVAAGETLALLFGKIKKFFTDQVAKNNEIDVTTSALQSGKQDTLIAGANITIIGNTISAKGGAGGEWKLVATANATGHANFSEDIESYNEILFILFSSNGDAVTMDYLPISIFKINPAYYFTEVGGTFYSSKVSYVNGTTFNVTLLNTFKSINILVR